MRKTENKKTTAVMDKPAGRKAKAEKVDYSNRPLAKAMSAFMGKDAKMRVNWRFNREVPVDKICPDASANYRWLTEDRKKADLKSEKVADIRESIEESGIHEPLKLVKDKALDAPYEYRCIGGNTRLALAIDVGIKTVPALIAPKDASAYNSSQLKIMELMDNADLRHEVSQEMTLLQLESLYNECGGPTPEFKRVARAITGKDADYVLRTLRPFMFSPKPIRTEIIKGRLDWRSAQHFIRKTKEKGEIVACEPSMTDADAKKVIAAIKTAHKEAVKSGKKGHKDSTGKFKVDVVRATLDAMAKDGELKSVDAKPSSRRSTPAVDMPKKEECLEAATGLADHVVVKEAATSDPDPLQEVESKYFDGTVQLAQEVDESMFDPMLERAVGICLARAIDNANLQGGVKEIERVKLTLILRAYSRVVVDDAWRKDKSPRVNPDTGKTKQVSNEDIIEDLISHLASARKIVSEDIEGNEVSISKPTVFDRVRAFNVRITQEMQDVGEDDEDFDDDE